MNLTIYQLNFLKKLSLGGSLNYDTLGDEINYMYPNDEADVEAKRQCEEMVKAGYLYKGGIGYKITEKGIKLLKERNLII